MVTTQGTAARREAFPSAVRIGRRVTMTGDDLAALRYAVATNEETTSWFSNHTAYAGPHMLVIADGIQHMSSPGRPSVIAVEELRRLDVLTDASGLAATLERGIEGLRETFRGLLAGDPGWDMTGVLLTAMLWRGTRAAIAHIGSTRAYMLRGGDLTQLTRDHTLGQELAEAGIIRPDETGSDPRYTSVMVRWLGLGRDSEPADITAHEAAIGDRYVLCTGGIERAMPPGTLRDILRDTARDPQDIADELAGTPLPAREYLRFTYIVADVVAQPR